jgi:hypothetical protein
MRAEATERFTDAHRKVMSMLGRLEAATTTEEATAACKDILTGLCDHFDEEERPDGLFDWIAALLPKGRDRVEGLWAEHEGMVREIEALGERLAGAGDSLDEAYRNALKAFAVHLREHEKNENELVNEALASIGGDAN